MTPAYAAADDPAGMQRLRQFLSSARSLRADFRQEVSGDAARAGEASSGHVVFRTPGRFRWTYEKPYERLLVADGQHVWLYEADLQQATVRPLRAGLGDTPAALLAGGEEGLKQFEFVNAWQGDGLAWVQLRPRAPDADFKAVAIAFAGDRPARLTLDDRLGQQTRLTFSHVEINPRVADADFEFHVPAGVDVIREGEL